MRTRKTFIGIGLLLSSALLRAQNVGIGTAMPHTAARLHVAGTNMGVLLPTAALSSATAWAPLAGAPQAGMIVYNTVTAGDVSPGYYYWDGSRWVRMDAGRAWLLIGNAGTNPAINFVGTTDNQPLVIRVGNQETFRFNTPGMAAPAWSIQRGGGDPRGLHAVDLQSFRNANTQVASGDYSVISGGYGNTASGYGSMVGGGYGNTANGGYSTVGGGYQNTASYAVSTVGGGYGNTASGDHSTVGGGRGNTASGTYSVIVGGYSNTANGAYNLVFGENVDPSVTESHRVYFFGDGSNPGGIANTSGFLVINRLDGDYPIHVGTNGTNGNGAYLSAGGAWTNASTRTKKDRFRPLDAGEVLGKIRALAVEGWYYKGTNEYHIGPYAEDFHEAFGTGVLDRPEDARQYLAASDVAGVALIGIQALAERGDAYERRITALEAENAELRAQLQALSAEVQRLRELGVARAEK